MSITWIILKMWGSVHRGKMAKKEKLKKKLKEVEKFRNELGKKTGLTVSSADIIGENRESTH